MAKCCREGLWEVLEGSVVKKRCREVLWRSVVVKCCREVL